jgi:signal transduction histidine kinase/CheY-like chemotaxis protein
VIRGEDQRRLIDRAFPFHFAVDATGRIVDSGPRLREIAGPALAEVDVFGDQIIEGPYRIRDHAALRGTDGDINVVAMPCLRGIRLRGEFVADPVDPEAPVRFLGHPWITGIDDLSKLGLNLKDFPPHSGLSDLLVNLKMRDSVNEELRRMAASLRERTQQLERELDHRQRLEAQLQHAQRMEALGRLAGGVAHDFNNALAAIGGHASLGSTSPDLENARRHFAQIKEATKRAGEITSRLLAFSRRRPIDSEDLSVDESIRESVSLLGPLLGERIVLELGVESGMPTVRTDATGLQQAIVNLVVNARDAMPDGGTIRVRARFENADEARTLRWGERGPGRWVVIEVQDHGTGIAPEVVDRIFDPFFTTKDLGEGTGLGLATVWWLVERSGGVIDVRSEIGQGTTFALHLPAGETMTSSATAGPGETVESAGDLGGGRHLLLVEDDPYILSATAQLLEADGFRVEAVSSGEEAIAVVDRSPEPFDVLVTDVVMAGMSGARLAELLTVRQPWIKVVLVSGYDDATVQANGGRGEILAKPFTLDEIRRAIGARTG